MSAGRLEALAEMTPVIWLHVAAALVALAVGAVVLWTPKGTSRHRLLGRSWAVTMIVVAGSSFFISTIGVVGRFSPIHLLSVYTLGSIGLGVWAARRGNIGLHLRTMQQLYAGALLIAGGFTVLPFRLLGRLLFGGTMPTVNYATTAVMLGLGAWLIVRTFVHPLVRSTPAE